MLRFVHAPRVTVCAACGGRIHKAYGDLGVNRCFTDGKGNYVHNIRRCVKLFKREKSSPEVPAR